MSKKESCYLTDIKETESVVSEVKSTLSIIIKEDDEDRKKDAMNGIVRTLNSLESFLKSTYRSEKQKIEFIDGGIDGIISELESISDMLTSAKENIVSGKYSMDVADKALTDTNTYLENAIICLKGGVCNE